MLLDKSLHELKLQSSDHGLEMYVEEDMFQIYDGEVMLMSGIGVQAGRDEMDHHTDRFIESVHYYLADAPSTVMVCDIKTHEEMMKLIRQLGLSQLAQQSVWLQAAA